jgi:hypothetical protein
MSKEAIAGIRLSDIQLEPDLRTLARVLDGICGLAAQLIRNERVSGTPAPAASLLKAEAFLVADKEHENNSEPQHGGESISLEKRRAFTNHRTSEES